MHVHRMGLAFVSSGAHGEVRHMGVHSLDRPDCSEHMHGGQMLRVCIKPRHCSDQGYN